MTSKTEHLLRYIKNETAEQKKERTRKRLSTMREKRELRSAGSGIAAIVPSEMTGYRLNIVYFEKGSYIKGTSKTFLIPEPKFSRLDLISNITDSLRQLRRNGSGTKKEGEKAIIV